MSIETNEDQSSQSKYTEAIVMAGNIHIDDEFEREFADSFYSQPPFQGLRIGDFHVAFEGVRYPSFAMTAAHVAAYAENGYIEAGLTPYEVVEDLCTKPGVFPFGTGPSPLRDMCCDALRRCLGDSRFDGAAHTNAQHMLESFAGPAGEPGNSETPSAAPANGGMNARGHDGCSVRFTLALPSGLHINDVTEVDVQILHDGGVEVINLASLIGCSTFVVESQESYDEEGEYLGGIENYPDKDDGCDPYEGCDSDEDDDDANEDARVDAMAPGRDA